MVKGRFKKKMDLTAHLLKHTPNDDEVTATKYTEEARGEGQSQKLILYYNSTGHIGTWSSTSRNGWSFI